MKADTLSNGTRIVKRYRKGRCYACAFAADTTDRQIKSQMSQGVAAFFPWNESTGQFDWNSDRDVKPVHIRR